VGLALLHRPSPRGPLANRGRSWRRTRSCPPGSDSEIPVAAEATARLTHGPQQLSRLLPGGLADKLRTDLSAADRTERLTVTVLMSDVRGCSAIAERTEPTILAKQLQEHRRAMNAAILGEGGTVMQYVGDAIMAVFGAPFPQDDHATRALVAAAQMHRRQPEVNLRWIAAGLEPFGLGTGVSTEVVGAALLGREERVEYTGRVVWLFELSTITDYRASIAGSTGAAGSWS
jgi:class 3 adenylate cyclase